MTVFRFSRISLIKDILMKEVNITMMKLYVGNLPYEINDQALEELFSEYGTVQSTSVITDRDTGRSKGFGFVEMDDAGAQTAMENLNNKEINGRSLKVNEARPRNDNRSYRR